MAHAAVLFNNKPRKYVLDNADHTAPTRQHDISKLCRSDQIRGVSAVYGIL